MQESVQWAGLDRLNYQVTTDVFLVCNLVNLLENHLVDSPTASFDLVESASWPVMGSLERGSSARITATTCYSSLIFVRTRSNNSKHRFLLLHCSCDDMWNTALIYVLKAHQANYSAMYSCLSRDRGT